MGGQLMLKLTSRYATALLEFAQERGLEDIYRQALLVVVKKAPARSWEATGALAEFLQHVPPKEVEPVLYRFLDLAREKMDLLEVEVISAVPLTGKQLATLEEKLIRIFRKQMEITTTVDPSILGGLRVIVGNTVLDDTIKRKLADMKNSVYKGVYFKQ